MPFGSDIPMTSIDGLTWTPLTTAVSASWNATAFGGGLFAGAGYNSTTAASIASNAVAPAPIYTATARTVITDVAVSGPAGSVCSLQLDRVPLLEGVAYAPFTAYELNQVLETGGVITGYSAAGATVQISGYEQAS